MLDHSTSISTFVIRNVNVESQEAAVAIAVALARSTTIESLQLASLPDQFEVAILERLRHNGSVK